MNQKNFGTQVALSEIFHGGKIDNDFVVEDKFVIGICRIYPDRSAQEHEYLIQEKSIVMRDTGSLSECVQEAKTLAYSSAIHRIPELDNVFLFPNMSAKSESEQVVARAKTEKPSEATPNENNISHLPIAEDEPTTVVQEPEPTWFNGARRVEIDDLKPVPPLESDKPAENEETAYEKALNMPITILGKLHECAGWSAGKILDEKPEIIAEFAHRYNGPKAEERDALKALYSEAVRRVNKAT